MFVPRVFRSLRDGSVAIELPGSSKESWYELVFRGEVADRTIPIGTLLTEEFVRDSAIHDFVELKLDPVATPPIESQ